MAFFVEICLPPVASGDSPEGHAVSLRSPGSLSGFPYLLSQIPAPVAALKRLGKVK